MAFLKAFDAKLRPILDAIDSCSRLLGTSSGIELPKTVVIGDQSSGKSSLIESIFGFSLPRGQDIVTRTPIQVEHRYSEDTRAEVSYRHDASSEAFQKILITDLDEIEEAVQRATIEVAGDGKDIVDNIIYLRVHSPNLPDLTVLDLPGITRNAVQGQSDNIEEIVTNLIKSHIAGDMTVLLCVVQASVDFSTAAAIKMAREHDPERNRTMGVVTKSDLAERGVDIIAKLEGSGNNLKLKLGFLPVRNRTAAELKENTPLDQVRAREEAFFRGHPELSKLPKDRRGIEALVQQLVKVQLECVVTALPKLKAQVRTKLYACRDELKQLQSSIVSDPTTASLRSLSLVNSLGSLYNSLRSGAYTAADGATGVDLRALGEAAEAQGEDVKVGRTFWEQADEYRRTIEEACCPKWFLTQECFDELKERSKDTRGTQLPNFLSHPLFVAVYHERVYNKLEAPTQELVGDVREYVEGVLGRLVDAVFRPFPKLLGTVKDQVQALLREQEEEARAHARLQVRQQKCVLTLNHYYSSTLESMRQALAALRGGADDGTRERLQRELGAEQYEAAVRMAQEGASNEDMGLQEMQFSLRALSKVVIKRVYDEIALGVRMHLVDDVHDRLAQFVQGELLGADGGGDTLLALMQDERQVRQRDDLARMVESLEKAWAKLKHTHA